jgi:hypothetical protein
MSHGDDRKLARLANTYGGVTETPYLPPTKTAEPESRKRRNIL